MSWDAYVDYVIAKSEGSVSQAVLIGLNGAIWTPASGSKIMPITQTEASALGPIFGQGKDGDGSSLQAHFSGSGIKVGDTKYMFLKVQDEGATKMVMGKRSGKGGITIGNTNQAVIIAFSPDGAAQGNAVKAVSATCEYLISQGF